MFLPFRPSWISSSPYPTLGAPLSSLRRPLSGPSSFFVPLRGYVFAFSPFVDIFLPLTRPLADPYRASADPLVVLRRSSCPFVDIFFLSFVPLGGPPSCPSWIALGFPLRGSPSRPLAPPSGSSADPLVSLRRSSWPFVDKFLPFRPSWISSSPYPTLGGSLSILRRPLSGPSSFFVALRGYVFLPFRGFPLSTRRPLADPYRSSSNPLVALRRS